MWLIKLDKVATFDVELTKTKLHALILNRPANRIRALCLCALCENYDIANWIK